MIVVVKLIKLHNFGSARKLTYRFNKPGLNLIQGRNGAGKTTIFNALSWVLYGKLVKEKSSVTPWKKSQTQEYDGTWVWLEFEKGEEVIRIGRTQDFKGEVLGRKVKSGIVITVNGKIKDDLRDKKDAQAWIIKTIGYSFELFKSSVLFGQKLKRLMGEDNSTKKKIMEEAFEVAYIAKANDLGRAKLAELEKDAVGLMSKKEGLQDKQETIQSALSNARQAIKDFKRSRKARMTELTLEIEGYKREISQYKKGNKELKKKKKLLNKLQPEQLAGLKDSEFRLNLSLNSEGSKLEKLNKEYLKLKEGYENPDRICGSCGAKIPKEKVAKYRAQVKKEIGSCLKEIKLQKRSLDELQTQYDGVLSELASFKKLENSITSLKNRIKFLEREKNNYHNIVGKMESCYQTLQKVKREECTIKAWELEEQLAKVKQELSELNDQVESSLRYVKVYTWLIKDPLSNGGLKAFIIDSMSSSINQVLKSLQYIVGFKIKLKVNLDSAYKDIKILVYQDKEEVPYEDLSGGQQQLVDISIAWSIERVITSTRPINIMLMDEVFESLDVENIEIIGKLLLERAQNKSIHLITHRRTFNPLNCNKITLTLNQGVTEMEA